MIRLESNLGRHESKSFMVHSNSKIFDDDVYEFGGTINQTSINEGGEFEKSSD